MLEDVSVPALLCSLVHMTGDPSWIRDRALPQPASSTDFQCGLTEDELADIPGGAARHRRVPRRRVRAPAPLPTSCCAR